MASKFATNRRRCRWINMSDKISIIGHFLHYSYWTKPLRGSCRVALVGATPSSCIFEEGRLRHHGGLLAAALPYCKGASHDCSSTTNDRGYAGTEPVTSHAG